MNPTTDPPSAAQTTGSLPTSWIHGGPPRRPDHDPKTQVHQYDERTAILRQSKSVNYEAPFLYLLFGNERALLLDTGATAEAELFPLRATVDRLLAVWLERHPREGYELVVAHTHGHNDHVAADAQFADRPATTVVGCHVEMKTRPGRVYPIGATYQPRERALQMTAADLKAVRDATVAVEGRRGVHRFADFVIYNEPRKRDFYRLLARGRLHQLFRV